MNVGFLGPSFSFSERAAFALAGTHSLLPCTDVAEMLSALEHGRVDAAVLPFDNSEVGHVPAAAEALLARGSPLAVTDETVLPIRFSLYRRKGNGDELKRVISHQMSVKQCARWLAGRHLVVEEVGSNGAAFIRARSAGEKDIGAIGPSGLADPDMEEVEADLQGPRAFETRFLLVERFPDKPERIRRALVAVDELTSICNGPVPATADLVACLPAARLGARTILAELSFEKALAPQALPGRPLLIWEAQEEV